MLFNQYRYFCSEANHHHHHFAPGVCMCIFLHLFFEPSRCFEHAGVTQILQPICYLSLSKELTIYSMATQLADRRIHPDLWSANPGLRSTIRPSHLFGRELIACLMHVERANPHQIAVKSFFWSSIESGD